MDGEVVAADIQEEVEEDNPSEEEVVYCQSNGVEVEELAVR